MALKVNADKAGYRELRILSQIKERHPQADNIIQLLDHFEHVGPNGVHLCLVLELMWTDVSDLMGGYHGYPEIRTVISKEVTRQALHGLEILSELKIAHNGRTIP